MLAEKPRSPDTIRAFSMGEKLGFTDSQSGDGTKILQGYFGVYNQRTVAYEGRTYRMEILIAPGAFDRALADPELDCHLMSLIHYPAGAPIGRTGKNLKLTADSHGLKGYSKLNPNDPDVQRLAVKMADGIVDQASFYFRVAPGGERWEIQEDENGVEVETWVITDIAKLFDVTVLAQGMFPQTSVEMTEFARQRFDLNRERASAVPDQDSGEGAAALNPSVPSNGEGAAVTSPAVNRQLAALRCTTVHNQFRKVEI